VADDLAPRPDSPTPARHPDGRPVLGGFSASGWPWCWRPPCR
jgi:hypothetical protein